MSQSTPEVVLENIANGIKSSEYRKERVQKSGHQCLPAPSPEERKRRRQSRRADRFRVGMLSITGTGTIVKHERDDRECQERLDLTILSKNIQVVLSTDNHIALEETEPIKDVGIGSRIRFFAKPYKIDGANLHVRALIPSPAEPMGPDELLCEQATQEDEEGGMRRFSIDLIDHRIQFVPIVN